MKVQLTAKQDEFLFSPAFEVLYGGKAGGGKSVGIILAPLIDMAGHTGYNAVLFRRTYPQLEGAGGLMPLAREFYGSIPGVHRRREGKLWDFGGDCTVKFSHLQYDLDRYDFQGHEYALIGFDELSHFSKVQYTYLFSRVRKRASAGFRTRVISASNPGADWVRERWAPWVDKYYKGKRAKPGEIRYFTSVEDSDEEIEVPAKMKDNPNVWSRTFIPASYKDNPFLDQSYERNLRMLPLIERMRLMDGDWNASPGRGLVLNRTWFSFADAFPPGLSYVRFWDFAATEKKAFRDDPDYTATALLAEHDGKVFIKLDRARMAWPDVKKWFLNVAKSEPRVRLAWEEEGGSSGKAISHELRIALSAIGRTGQGIRASGDKMQRVNTWSANAERGEIVIVTNANLNSDDVLAEFHAFPEGAHDDLLDAVSGAWAMLNRTAFASGFGGSKLY